MTKEGINSAEGHLKVTDAATQWRENDYSGVCPVRDLLRRIGDKWTVLVVLRLGQQPERFRSLQRAIDGISQRMLTVTLRGLERDGLVARRVFDTRPPAVEYSLTPLGRSLLSHLAPFAQWAISNEQHIKAAQSAFDRRPDV